MFFRLDFCLWVTAFFCQLRLALYIPIRFLSGGGGGSKAPQKALQNRYQIEFPTCLCIHRLNHTGIRDVQVFTGISHWTRITKDIVMCREDTSRTPSTALAEDNRLIIAAVCIVIIHQVLAGGFVSSTVGCGVDDDDTCRTLDEGCVSLAYNLGNQTSYKIDKTS